MSMIVLHDYFESADGGGRLSTILADALQADLAYGFARLPHPFVHGPNVNPRERSLGVHRTLPLWRQFQLARGFEYHTDFLNDYACRIYSGFYTPLAALHQNAGRNILYCHTPPRFIYDQYEFYQQQLPLPLRPLLNAFIRYLKPRYEAAVAKMDCVVTNSHNVQQRLQQHLGVPSEVVYPPCDTERFRWVMQDDFYLSTARLDPLKRIDVVVRAFTRMPDKKLIVTSGGNELKRLQKLAQNAPNIHFTGRLPDDDLTDLVGRAIATIYLPKDEDFGMSPVESMAAGKPVIGVAEGGLLESIVDGETGLLLPSPPTPEMLVDAVRGLSPSRALSMRSACELRAAMFDQSVFITQMKALIDET